MNKYLYTFLLLVIFSCNRANQDISNGEFIPPAVTESVGMGVDMNAIIERKGHILEQACTIVPQDVIANVLGLTPEDLLISDSSPRDANATRSSCFFKWTEYDLPNAGIFFQMMLNPNEEELQGYIEGYVQSFRTRGEASMEGSPIIYEQLNGLGDDGAYSYEGGKYVWRLSDKIAFMIAFNTTHTPQEQYRIAMTLGKEMTQNYLKI